ncbi:hotdog fold thioesterase [Cellulosimicrobium arenosum]|uniref:Hotdog fold thioesterase n=1 Tax=Cellulosimicrobium arenosum TaxID=2708133 RepID=A0A927G6N5_9MICO|nr:hotdog fold thioesterase [Cellulosimicrobium arenosum]
MTDTHGADDARTPPPATGSPDRAADALPLDLDGTLLERMGIELGELTAARATGRMPVAGNTQPAGLLHGGASVVLAETLGSIAAQLHGGRTRAAVGIEINATHHRAVRQGWVHGEARALHTGRTTVSYEIVVSDDDGRRVCTARLTCMLLDVP